MTKIAFEIPDETLDIIANKTADIMEKRASEKISTGIDLKKEFYTVNELAELSSCDGWTIREHIKAQIISASKPGKKYLISKHEVLKYLNRNNGQQ